jgi:CheY-like chemotaxis protein
MPADILLVDDQRDITRFLRHALESLGRGLRIVESLSAEEALLELRGGGVQVLVTDLRLPGMDGLALLGRLRTVSPATRAVMISGLADGPQRQAAEQLGAEAVLAKPIELSEFLATVTRLLDKRNERSEPHGAEAAEAHQARAATPPRLRADEALTVAGPDPTRPTERPPTPEAALRAVAIALRATSAWLADAEGRIQVRVGEPVPAVTDQFLALADVVRAGRLALEAMRQPAGGQWHELTSAHGVLWLTELAPGQILGALGPIGAERPHDHDSLDAARAGLTTALAADQTPAHPPPPATTLHVAALGTAELRALDDALSALDSHDAHAFWD